MTISLHTVMIGGPNGGGLPVPPLGVTFDPPDGVAQPVVTENIGSTTTVNNDAHVRVWIAQIPAEGTYNITTDGKVNGYIDPRLAFGHRQSDRFSGVGVRRHVRRGPDRIDRGVEVAGPRPPQRGAGRSRGGRTTGFPFRHPPVIKPTVTSVAHEPSDEGVRLERLKTLAALRDSGALTDAEFEAEKRRILDGDPSVAPGPPIRRNARSRRRCGGVAVAGVDDGVAGQLAQPLGDRREDRGEVGVRPARRARAARRTGCRR